MLHKCGICISYNYLLLLYNFWAVRDTESSNTCPRGIAYNKPAIVFVDNDDFKYGKPAIVIVDNDDFKIDTLTGNANGAHRTNVLYVQPEKYEIECEEATEVTSYKKKDLAIQLGEKCKKLTSALMVQVMSLHSELQQLSQLQGCMHKDIVQSYTCYLE